MEPINKAARQATMLAVDCGKEARLTTSFPLPATHQVIFYLLTDQGILTAAVTEQELSSGNHPLKNLGNAMQDVITQYSLIDSDHAAT